MSIDIFQNLGRRVYCALVVYSIMRLLLLYQFGENHMEQRGSKNKNNDKARPIFNTLS